MDDRIEKHIELKAPVSRVWRALTDHREFGEWFKMARSLRDRCRVAILLIPVTSTSNGRQWCRRWSRNGFFLLPGILMPSTPK